MAIEITRGDIVSAQAEALVNTVNCVGFMGRGIALQFKRAYPRNFADYESACRRGDVVPGRMLVHATGNVAGTRYIINFPTKRHWRGRSRLEDIDAGLVALIAELRRLGVTSVAVPPLGCGLGGLDWNVVRPRIEAAFQALPNLRVLLFEPSGAPASQQVHNELGDLKLTPGRATLVALMGKYLDGLMDTEITLLEVHKLMYFMQEAGEPLRLRYVKASYGPYGENLRQVLARVEGRLVVGYRDGGDAPDKRLSIVPGALSDADAVLKDNRATQKRFDRVSRLVSGFETPFGMELLASVHWVATREGATSSEAVRGALYSWNDRKRRFTEQQIDIALDRLRRQGWVA